MKKLSIFLSLALLFIFVGCSEEQIPPEPAIENYESRFSDISYEECDYILNKNTGKFHNKDCFTIKLMLEKNKVYCNDERNSIVENGYIPCLKCNP